MFDERKRGSSFLVRTGPVTVSTLTRVMRVRKLLLFAASARRLVSHQREKNACAMPFRSLPFATALRQESCAARSSGSLGIAAKNMRDASVRRLAPRRTLNASCSVRAQSHANCTVRSPYCTMRSVQRFYSSAVKPTL